MACIHVHLEVHMDMRAPDCVCPFRLAGCGFRWSADTRETVCLTLHRGSCCDQNCIKMGNKTWNVKLEKVSSFCSWSLKLFFGFFRRRNSLIVHRKSQVAVRSFLFHRKMSPLFEGPLACISKYCSPCEQLSLRFLPAELRWWVLENKSACIRVAGSWYLRLSCGWNPSCSLSFISSRLWRRPFLIQWGNLKFDAIRNVR